MTNDSYSIPTRLVKSFMGKSLVEINMNRLMKHLDSEQGFFIISLHLPNLAEDEEIHRARDLRQRLTSLKLGYIPLRARFVNSNTNKEQHEHCFFVHKSQRNDFKQIALELCKAFGQEVLFVENRKAYSLYQNGDTFLIGDCIGTIEEINQYWSKIKEGLVDYKHIAFESLYPISNFGLNEAHNCGELL